MVKSSPTRDTAVFNDRLESRETIGKIYEYVFLIGLLIGLFVLALLLLNVFHDGLARLLTPGFLTETPSRFPERGGIRPAIYAVGAVLFLITLALNIGSYWISNRFKEKYD